MVEKKGEDSVTAFVAWNQVKELFEGKFKHLSQDQLDLLSTEEQQKQSLSREQLEIKYIQALQLAQLKGWVKTENNLPSEYLRKIWNSPSASYVTSSLKLMLGLVIYLIPYVYGLVLYGTVLSLVKLEFILTICI